MTVPAEEAAMTPQILDSASAAGVLPAAYDGFVLGDVVVMGEKGAPRTDERPAYRGTPEGRGHWRTAAETANTIKTTTAFERRPTRTRRGHTRHCKRRTRERTVVSA